MSEPRSAERPRAVEELIDLWWHRPLAAVLTRKLVNAPITPDQVTVLSGMLGMLAGIVLWRASEQPEARVAAGGLLFLSVIFDCVDGQLARARKTATTLGAILDGVCDYVVVTSVFLGLLRAAPFPLLLAAGLSFLLQCYLYDRYKFRYEKHAGFWERDGDVTAAKREDTRSRLLLWVYEGYQGLQERLLPDRPSAHCLGLARHWSFMGLGTHLFILYGSLVLSAWWPPALGLGLLVFVAGMNPWLLWLLSRERR